MSVKSDPQMPEASLWPSVVAKTTLRSPAAILKEQAGFLGQATQNVVRGEVRLKDRGMGELSYGFSLVAPALNNYRLELFEIVQDPLKIYPVTIRSSFLNELDLPFGSAWTAQDEGSLLSMLKQIFANGKVMEAVQALLAQSES
jgi:hypothetical protein